MPCPVCSHTIHRISEAYFWCPRCGSLIAPLGVPDHEAPKIVGRVNRAICIIEELGGNDYTATLRETVGLPLRAEPAESTADRIAHECPGHGRGGQGEKCCERAGEYNGFASGPMTFVCPKHCSCHD